MKKRFYKNLVVAVVEGLEQIFHYAWQADDVVGKLLKSNSKWGSRDRRFIASSIYETVRWYRLYYEIYGKKPVTKEDWWHILAISWTLEDIELPDWEIYKDTDVEAILSKAEEVKKTRKFRASIPDWLDDAGSMELGEDWDATIQALNQPAQVCLRVNTLKTTRQKLQKALAKENVETTVHNNVALLLKKRQKVTHTKCYQKGWFEVQDVSSQQVATFLEVKPYMHVVDACAGAGGKSLHLAALMEDKGKLTALDIVEKKLKELNKRAHRAGAHLIHTKLIDDPSVIRNLSHTADRLLLDVPCSGLGVLRRNPDSKWKLTPDFADHLKKIQQDILQDYSNICKVGGKMVYATCSILPSENELQVQEFLDSKKGKDFKFLEQKTILPQDEGFDGFYMALLERIS